MSEKKTNPEIQEQNPEIQTTEAKYNPWERIPVKLPRAGEREDQNKFVCINGTNYVIPMGKTSMVPRCVAEELERSERARDRYDKTCDRLMKQQPA